MMGLMTLSLYMIVTFFLLIFMMIAVAFYVVSAISLSKLATAYGYKNSYLAWIPFANAYLLGLIIDEKSTSKLNFAKGYNKFILCFAPIVIGVFMNYSQVTEKVLLIILSIYTLIAILSLAETIEGLNIRNVLLSIFGLNFINYFIFAKKIIKMNAYNNDATSEKQSETDEKTISKETTMPTDDEQNNSDSEDITS